MEVGQILRLKADGPHFGPFGRNLAIYLPYILVGAAMLFTQHMPTKQK